MTEPSLIYRNNRTKIWFFQQHNIVCTETFFFNDRGHSSILHLVGGTEESRHAVHKFMESFHHELCETA